MPTAQQPPPPARELLDSRDVSRILGLGRTKVFAMMARAELPVVRIGRLVRVPRSALMAWIESETVCEPGPRRAKRPA
jgi:excisionase family DNA binding protein